MEENSTNTTAAPAAQPDETPAAVLPAPEVREAVDNAFKALKALGDVKGVTVFADISFPAVSSGNPDDDTRADNVIISGVRMDIIKSLINQYNDSNVVRGFLDDVCTLAKNPDKQALFALKYFLQRGMAPEEITGILDRDVSFEGIFAKRGRAVPAIPALLSRSTVEEILKAAGLPQAETSGRECDDDAPKPMI